tara:strand:+ start:24010 stop:25068 length:1059 start_codon:yes stop_codon:yes gene_type:complete
MKNNFDTVIFASDCNDFTGEGILANRFINDYKNIKNNEKIYVYSFENIFFLKNKNKSFLRSNDKKKIKNNFIFRYLRPIIGIFLLWYYFFKNKKIIYLNFLPLWNFLLFIFLPPKTILGPITGSYEIRSNKNLKKVLLFFLFKISLFFLNLRMHRALFARDLIRKILSKDNLKNFFFNYQIRVLEDCNDLKMKKKYEKKEIDLILYFRNYHSKDNQFFKYIVNKLKKSFNIVIVGDYLNEKNIKNLGYVNRSKIFKLLKKSRFTIISSENFYSNFSLDAISNNVGLIYEKSIKPRINYFNNLTYPVNFNKLSNVESKIIQILKSKKKTKKNLYLNKKYFVIKKNFINYLDQF